ncbi:hypothetical protein BV22DRAFT_878085 [Leucogyrophana mollusca]|uniref:Uncharacterized protein n=1 Tax=Leucogyrophana mollusca TaxID=85980 RepID=A0ACB8AZW8_9AGAM|nr:hypothetical protein BV22DRAFT_878085 [Leucogyrophana mollusca]
MVIASKGSAVEARALGAIREVDSAAYGRGSPSQGASSGRVHGPTLPSSLDLILA